VVVFTGDYDSQDPDCVSSSSAAIFGDRCVVQTLTTANAESTPSINGVDGDTCFDVVVAPGEKVETTITFAEAFTIPCTDYGTGENTVKLQICSTSRTKIDDSSCDINGPYPCDPEACWCDTIDIPSVALLSKDEATPTCEPTPESEVGDVPTVPTFTTTVNVPTPPTPTTTADVPTIPTPTTTVEVSTVTPPPVPAQVPAPEVS
jgi:hypothetical protein